MTIGFPVAVLPSKPLASSGVSTLIGVDGSGGIVRLPSPTVYVNAHGAVPDCTGQGVGTDVIPAIQAAVTEALSLYGNGATVCLLPGRYRAATAAILDFGGGRNVTLDLQGAITPDSTSMTVMKLRNATCFTLTANILEGGIFNGWSDPNPYGAATDDYYTTADVVSLGGQQMFQIEGIFDYEVNIRAHAYAGRVLRTTKPANVSHPPTGAIKGAIYTGRSNDTNEPRTCQALWADYDTTVGQGNWGGLREIVADFDYWGPVWTDLNDIEVDKIDAAYARSGVELRGCVVVEGDNWYIGTVDTNSSNNHFAFIQSANRACQHARVTKIRGLNAGTILYADGLQHFSFPHVNAQGSAVYTDAVHLKNAQFGDVGVDAFSGGRIVFVEGSSAGEIWISPVSYGTMTGDHIQIDSTVLGNVYIRDAHLAVAAAGKSLIKVDSASAKVFIIDAELSSNTGNIFDISSASNNVYVNGGRVSGSATTYESSIEPVVIVGMIGITSKFNGDLRANTGGNSAGSGGAVQIGISTAGLQAYSPMAQLKGKLVTSTGTELQGGASIQIRATGVAPQSLVDAIEASYTTTNGETLMILLCREAGVYTARRVLIGAAGTGPGGSGKALYTA
jgi:hypothetical protein